MLLILNMHKHYIKILDLRYCCMQSMWAEQIMFISIEVQGFWLL